MATSIATISTERISKQLYDHSNNSRTSMSVTQVVTVWLSHTTCEFPRDSVALRRMWYRCPWKNNSFQASLCLALQWQKLLSTPWFGVLQARLPKGLPLWRSVIFTDTGRMSNLSWSIWLDHWTDQSELIISCPPYGLFLKIQVLNALPDPWASNSGMHAFPGEEYGFDTIDLKSCGLKLWDPTVGRAGQYTMTYNCSVLFHDMKINRNINTWHTILHCNTI